MWSQRSHRISFFFFCFFYVQGNVTFTAGSMSPADSGNVLSRKQQQQNSRGGRGFRTMRPDLMDVKRRNKNRRARKQREAAAAAAASALDISQSSFDYNYLHPHHPVGHHIDSPHPMAQQQYSPQHAGM